MDIINSSPLAPLFTDDSITEIMVNRFDRIFIERSGEIEGTAVRFSSPNELFQLAVGLAKARGTNLTMENPCLDASLEDGSRINITIPPMSLEGPVLTIRKFGSRILSLDDLVQMGCLTLKAKQFISFCIQARANIIISGGTSSGKTTLLNAAAHEIPRQQRIVTIEDTPELRLPHENWVRLESVHSLSGMNVSVRDCVVAALRMRPDRIIVGECRKSETFEMLQAMNTGHDGSLTSIHSNSPRDCLARIESLILSNMDFPLLALRRQIASAINFIVQIKRDRGGDRIITEIVEVTGIEKDTITLQPIFVLGPHEELDLTGFVPKFLPEMQARRVRIPANFFDSRS